MPPSFYNAGIDLLLCISQCNAHHLAYCDDTINKAWLDSHERDSSASQGTIDPQLAGKPVCREAGCDWQSAFLHIRHVPTLPRDIAG
jgi:hypothetical protein